MNIEIVKQKEVDGHGSWWLMVDGQRAGLLDYTRISQTLIRIDHTEVDAAQGGKGRAKELILATVDDARKSGHKIVPMCSYARVVFARTPEIQDTLQ